MNKTILMGVSALAIMVAGPVMAADTAVKTDTGAAVKVEGPNTDNKADDARRANKITSEEVDEAMEDVSEAVDEAYRDMRNFFTQDTAPRDLKQVGIAKNQTAAGMIGETVKDMSGATVGNVKDIIVDQNGNAKMVIISDGGILGLGDKLAAFDYDVMVSRNKDGDVISTLSDKTIERAAEFSYDMEDGGKDVRVMPAGGYSIAKLVDAQLLNPQNKPVADVENISFRDGQVDLVVVAFNQILGLGGEKAVMSFDQLALVKQKNEVDFKLTAAQAAKFESFKDTSSN